MKDIFNFYTENAEGRISMGNDIELADNPGTLLRKGVDHLIVVRMCHTV